ncbi:SemiSWEET family sugar transporter [Allokutzneria sp. NRRL B-24872]|uniref:SemiSWEET family sugar transporter n=1 Tax=Allokutzneria sp. NRRL B-24872 TaxID=1137961 RepID=UPI000A39E1DB|nr:hypothetical protein [Allokutzneria sp. NRRL B-24872]
MTAIGFLAGILTTACWVPQLMRSWKTRSTPKNRLRVRASALPSPPIDLIVISAGVALWAVYGVWQGDAAVIAANVATLCFLLFLIGLKLTERRRGVVA